MKIMPAPEDDRFLSAQEIKAATATGRLPALAERLARERAWFALASLFEQASTLALPLPALTETVRRCTLALRDISERRHDRAAPVNEARTARLLAGEALLARVPGVALTEIDRQALVVGGWALADAGDLVRAASTFQLGHDWAAAAETWGRLGELDRMEDCLGREEDRSRTRRAAIGAIRDIEAAAAAGERLTALRLAEGVPEGVAESNAARHLALGLGARLVRSRSVMVRITTEAHVRNVCFSALPAVLGRDPLAEIPLRDPGVSRRHALLGLVAGELCLTDAASRAGTFVAGARISHPLPLKGATEVTLGTSCRLALEPVAAGPNERVLLRGLSGLDRALVAMLGTGALPLMDLIPAASGTWLEFEPLGVRFCRAPGMRVRISGQLVSQRVELLHGDKLEIDSDHNVRLEVL